MPYTHICDTKFDNALEMHMNAIIGYFKYQIKHIYLIYLGLTKSICVMQCERKLLTLMSALIFFQIRNTYLKTVLVLTTDEQPELLRGGGGVVPKDQFLLAEAQWRLILG